MDLDIIVISTAKKNTEWFGMKVTPEQKDKIRRLAERRGVSQKKVVLDLVEKEFQGETVKAEPGSILEKTRDLCGMYEGPEDLSTNPKHMEGYGQ